MNVLILSGFLGSGKTTALMSLARFLTSRHAESGSFTDGRLAVMILENEVGDAGVDDVLLRGSGFSVENLFAGCACCTVSEELVSAAARIRGEYDPEWLVVETTGVAYPRKIRENLELALGLASKTVVVADAARWRRLFVPMNNLLLSQIEKADAVLVNKTDLVDAAALESVERDIRGFDPEAKILRVSAASGIADPVWEEALGL